MVIHHKYFKTIKPPISNIMNTRHNQLKYLSINGLIVGPYLQKRPATKKNLAERLMVEAIIKPGKLILAIPAEIVHTLYGKGVKPHAKTIQKSYLLYQP